MKASKMNNSINPRRYPQTLAASGMGAMALRLALFASQSAGRIKMRLA